MSNDPSSYPSGARPRVSRRQVVRAGAVLGGLPLLGVAPLTGSPEHAAAQATPAATPATPIAPAAGPERDTLTIDLTGEPDILDPTRTYTVDGWSVIHSIYDTLLFRAADGSLQPLLAESWSQPDDVTIEFRLRAGISFHNGEPFDARSVATTVAHMQAKETASQVASDFATIQQVEQVNPQTVRFHLTQPSPALLNQVAVYLAMLPPEYVSAPGFDFGTAAPVGTGPYVWQSWDRGQQITLTANPNAFASAKGAPIAKTVHFRFVTDAATRTSDLLAGTADLVRSVPPDQVDSVNGSGAAQTVIAPVAGVAFVRMIDSQQPWANTDVRRAANYAVDVDSIITALNGGNGQRLASLLAPESIGFDPNLKPYDFDTDKAKGLIQNADLAYSLRTALQISDPADADIAQAIASQLNDAGFRVSVDQVDQTTFNQTWQNDTDKSGGLATILALRLVTWRPLFDPQSLFDLMFTSFGPLSRFSDTDIDRDLIEASKETNPDQRAEQFRTIASLYHDNPPAIFLWNLTATYGLSKQLTGWQPRSDEYVLPLRTA